MSSVSSREAEPAWPVLVVCADAVRVGEVRRTLGAWPVPVVLTVISSTMAAMGHALVQQPRLVIVDWAVDGSGGQALVRQLARLRPNLQVLAFDVNELHGPADRVLTWPWDDLHAVLDRWLVLAAEDR